MNNETTDRTATDVRETVALAFNLVYRLAKISSQKTSENEINYVNHLLLTKELETICSNGEYEAYE